jgi:hypothetical protein
MQRYADLGLAVRGNAECGAMAWHSGQPEALGCLRRDAPRYWWHQIEAAEESQVKLGN